MVFCGGEGQNKAVEQSIARYVIFAMENDAFPKLEQSHTERGKAEGHPNVEATDEIVKTLVGLQKL